MYLWVDTAIDYDTYVYYSVAHWGYYYKNSDIMDSFGAQNDFGEDAYSEEFFPYDPNADYTIESYPNLIAKVRHDYGDTYEDYCDYIQWAMGDEPVYYPNYFDFNGSGPDVQINGSSILLGAVYSFFTEGGLARPPDHVKVVSDDTTYDHDCYFPFRKLTLQVVDGNVPARRVGVNISIRERFFTVEDWNAEIGGVWSTCVNDWSKPSGCGVHFLGKFTDNMFAGCPPPPVPSYCGLPQFVVKWIWCPRGKPEKTLMMHVRDETSEHILTNGSGHYLPGTELR